MRSKLSNATVRSLAIEDKRYEVVDTELTGLRVRVAPSGKKSWAVLYVNAEGRRRRYTVGTFPAVTADQARTILGQAAQGRDPATEKRKIRLNAKQRSEMPTLREFIEGDYANWATAHKRDAPKSIARIRSTYRSLLDKKLCDITAWQLDKVRAARLRDGISRHTVERDRSALSQLYEVAITAGACSTNPAEGRKFQICVIDCQAAN